MRRPQPSFCRFRSVSPSATVAIHKRSRNREPMEGKKNQATPTVVDAFFIEHQLLKRPAHRPTGATPCRCTVLDLDGGEAHFLTSVNESVATSCCPFWATESAAYTEKNAFRTTPLMNSRVDNGALKERSGWDCLNLIPAHGLSLRTHMFKQKNKRIVRITQKLECMRNSSPPPAKKKCFT